MVIPPGVFMKFIPNFCIQQEMIQELGLQSIDELFSDIPKKLRCKPLQLPTEKTQQDVEYHLRTLGKKNISFFDQPSFLGGGVQPHYIPAVVSSILSRSEFYTSYTPYQPEASQGFLQAMFEYQSIIAELTGMDVANASLYDGMTALGEAALLSCRHTKKNVFLIPANISWEKQSIVKNYTHGQNITIKTVNYDTTTGMIDTKHLKELINDDVAGIYIENPNFFGVFETNVHNIQQLCHANNSLFVVGVHPLSLGIIESPGHYGADIVLGEGRCLGNSMDMGGSTLGIFACKHQFLRQLPGRVIGLTKDKQGKQAFCMTLQTREQHIRRARATSNICTNEGLCALAAVVYLSWLGPSGLTSLGNHNIELAYELKQQLTDLGCFKTAFTGSHFNEFVLSYEGNLSKLKQSLEKKHIQPGVPLKPWYPNLDHHLLFGVSELATTETITTYVNTIKEAL